MKNLNWKVTDLIGKTIQDVKTNNEDEFELRILFTDGTILIIDEPQLGLEV